MENIMNLQENKDAFSDAIRAASEYLGISGERNYFRTS